MLDKLQKTISALMASITAVEGEVQQLKKLPTPKDGVSPAMADIVAEVLAQMPTPKDGVSPSVDAIVAEVLAQIPTPKDGEPGEDADVDAVAFKVFSVMEKPKDGVSPAMADIVASVLAKMPTPKDGVSPAMADIVASVLAQMPTPTAAEIVKKARDGKNGVSVTKVKLEKGNQLAVWLDGVRRVVGKIEVPKPAVEFTPASGGGTRRTIEVPVETPLAGFISYSDDTITLSADEDAPSFLTGLVLEGTGYSLADPLTGAVRNDSGKAQTVDGLISFHPNKTAGGTIIIDVFSETSTDGGLSYQLNAGSLRPVEVSNSGESFKSTVSFAIDWPPGALIRFRMLASTAGGMNIEPSSSTVLGGQTITGHSIVWNLSKNNG